MDEKKGLYEKIEGPNCSPTTRYSTIQSFGISIDVDGDTESSCRQCCLWCNERFFTKEKLKRRIPICSKMSAWRMHHLQGDIIAGISVAFTIVPQGLALAALAGLPPEYGLYSSFIGSFIYAFFGTCKDAAIGPTSILAILIAPYVAMGGTPYAIMLSLLTGCIMLLLGLLNFGFVVEFVPFPVISSFSTAAALTIAASQLKSFVGIQYAGSRFFPTLKGFISHVHHLNPSDLILGLLCLLFLVPVQMKKDFRISDGVTTSWCRNALNACWAFIVIARNAIVLLFTALISIMLSDQIPISVTGHIKPGFPDIQAPDFNIHTNTTEISFPMMLADVWPGAAVIALVGMMETVAVAKAFTSSTKLDATQEMIALGLCNIVGSFFGAFPVAGSFSRSAVNHASGVQTTFSGIITSILVVVALVTLSPLFELIPKAALASIIIAAVLPMIRFGEIVTVWRAEKLDVISYTVTITFCLFTGLEFGIILGLFVSLGRLLYEIARPRVTVVTKRTPGRDTFLVVKPDRNIYYPAVEYVKVKINKALQDNEDCDLRTAVVIDCEHVFRIDSTTAVGIKQLIRDFRKTGRLVIFSNLRTAVKRSLTKTLNDYDTLIYSRTQQEVYAAIKFHKENGFLISNFVEENHNNSNERYWLTQSTDESTRN